MKWLLIILVLYETVSGTLLWSNSKFKTGGNNDLNNMFSNLLNDFNLDISLAPNTKSFSNFNDNYNYNYYIDQSPSSMFAFPSTFGDKLQSPMHIRPKWNNPLYLMVESKNGNDANPSSSTYTLTKSNKVNGNTWRYTVNTDKNGKQITKSWSTQKMYLCNSVSCSEQNGMEMKNIHKYQNYMHLVPTSTTMEPLGTDYEDIGDEEDDDDGFHIDLDGLMDMASNWMKGGKKRTDDDGNNDNMSSLMQYAFNKANDILDRYNNNKRNDTKYTSKGRINLDGLMDKISEWWPMDNNVYDDDYDYDIDTNYEYDTDYDDVDDDDKEEEENNDILGEGMSLNGLLDTFSSFWSKDINNYDDIDTNYDEETDGNYMYENDEDEIVENEENEDEDDDDDDDDKADEIEEDVVENEENEENEVESDVFMENDNNNRLLSDGDTNIESLGYEEKHDLLFIEMTVIIIFIMICGVLYGAWRFLLDRREKQRELDYYNINVSNGL